MIPFESEFLDKGLIVQLSYLLDNEGSDHYKNGSWVKELSREKEL